MTIRPYILTVTCLTVLALASASDIRSQRIPNYLSVILVLMSLAIYSMTAGIDGLFFSLKGMALGFIILFVPYLFGGMGAGDVKLMAGVGAALGPWQALMALLFTSLIGGFVAIIIIFAGKGVRGSLKNYFASAWLVLSGAGVQTLKAGLEHKKKTKVPYGFVIACGTVLSMVWRVIIQGEIPVGSMKSAIF